MKKLLTYLCALTLCITCLLCLPPTVKAESYYNDFTYTVSGGKATITDYTGSATNLVIPSTLGGYPVTTINGSAFYNCTSLQSVTIGDSVTTIGYRAFYKCTSLQSVTIGDSVTTIGDSTFSGCSSLQSVTIGDSVTTIGNRAFYECTSLQSITIPDSVTTIGGSAFYSCKSLQSITIPDSVTTIGSFAFIDCSSLQSVTIGDSVTTIGSEAFSWCDSLTGIWVDTDNANYSSDTYGVLFNKDKTELIQAHHAISGGYTIPNSVTTIGSYAFNSCDSLQSVTIGDSVTTIGYCAFYKCSSLQSVTIGNSVTTIGQYAFYYCDSLQSITIPDSVTTIGDSAFTGCSSLQSITIPDSVTTIGDFAFYACGSLTSITIPDSVTTIGEYAFCNCDSLTSVTIPNSVTTIGGSAFESCSSLQSVTIGDSVTTIGSEAFYDCDNLTSITIPDSVTTIGKGAFYCCYKLTNVYYAGSQSQWQNINIDSHNNDLTSATIHYNHIHDYTLIPAVRVEATCTENGYIDHTCIYGETMREILPALGHISGSDTTVVAPTCTEQGYTVFTCTRCGEQGRTDYTRSLGHNFSGTVTVVAPTCTQQGYTATQCTRCTATNYDYTDELGHKLGYVAPADATCTEPGKSYGTKCERCDFWGVQQTETSPALGHSFTNYVSDNNATYDTDGTKTAQCDRCSATDTVTDSGTKLIGGTCGDDLTWQLDSEGTLTISGTGAMYDYSPTSVPWYAYKEQIICVNICDGVTTIGSYAFSFVGTTTPAASNANTVRSGLGANGGFANRDGNNIKTVTIPVSVTSIGDHAFANCTSLQTVIYGGTQAQWSAITVGVGNEALANATVIYLGEIKLSGASPVLYENMAIQYKANKTKFDALGITDPYLVVTFNGVETVITDYQISDDGTRYIFPFYNIAPNQMNDTITAVLYATYNGEVYAANPKDYSMAEYCYTQLGKYSDEAYAEFRTLLVDLLNYGAVSQQFTGYKTDNMVNAALTETQKSWATQTDRSYTNVQTTKYATISNPTVSWKGGSLVLTDAVVMRLRFETANTDGLSFKVTSGNSTWWISDISTEGESTYIYFRGLNAGQMSDEVFITAYQNGVAVSNTVRYSIESYASQKVADTATPYLAELVDAMMKYGDSAKAYVH